MAVKFANNVSTTLSAAINATQTTISVADASGLPTLSSGDYVYLTLDTDTNSPTIEVVKVTAISSNSLTVVRGQDGTTASSFSNGTKIELRVTAAALDDISSAADTESVSIAGDTMTGALTTTGLTVNGNAILGSTAANYDQYIRGNANVGLRIQTNAQGTTSSDGMRIGLNGVHGFVWQFEEKPLAFATSGIERLSISSGGAFDFKGGNFSSVGTISSGAITSTGNITSGNDVFVPNGRFFRFTAASSNSSGGFLFGNSSGTGGSIAFKRNSDSAAVLTLNADQSATFAGTISSGAITSSASVIASGNSNSFGNTTISNLSATSVTASGSITASGNSNSFGNTTVGTLTSGAITSSGAISGTSINFSNSHSKTKIRLFGSADNAHNIGTESYHNTYGPNSWTGGTIGHKFYGTPTSLIAKLGTGGASGDLNSEFYGSVKVDQTSSSLIDHLVLENDNAGGAGGAIAFKQLGGTKAKLKSYFGSNQWTFAIDTEDTTDAFEIYDNGTVNISGALKSGGQTVIDSSRNLTNIAKATFSGSGSSTSPLLGLSVTGSGAYIHASNSFASGMGSSNFVGHFFGKSGSTKNAGYIGYEWLADGDDTNYVSLGHWGNNHLLRLYADGDLNINDGGLQVGGTTVIDSSRQFVVNSHIYFGGATNQSFIRQQNTNLEFFGDGNLSFRTYNGGWYERLQVNDSGITVTGSISGALASSVTATTQSASDNSTKVATTAYVTTAIDNIVDAAPGSLDTLNELAAALGDDANFSTTVTNSIATKLPLAGGTMTGSINMGANNISNLGAMDTDVAFPRDHVIKWQDGGSSYSNIIKAGLYPSQGYTGNNTFWIEYAAKGGHNFIVNTDGGSTASENTFDHFTIWQGAVDGRKLFWVTNSNGHVNSRGSFYPSGQTTNYVDSTRIANWQTAYGWGDHASQPYAKTNTANTFTALQTFSGSADANWKLTASNAASSWRTLEFEATTEWGDSAAYGVLGGTTGVMLRRPHVVWSSGDSTADIRFGRSGGTSSGSWYGIGTLASNVFSIHKDNKSSPILTFNGSNTWDFKANNIAVNGQNVIDSSRNLTNIGTISSGAITTSGTFNQTTSNTVLGYLKGTNSGTNGFAEYHIRNDNNDALVIGSIGSNYTPTAWAGSRYIYSTHGELRIKAATNLRLYSGGFNHDGDLAITMDENQEVTIHKDMTLNGEFNGDLFVRDGRITVKRGTGLTTTIIEDDSSANGRGQLLLDSAYSDMIIASRQANSNKHGSNLTFATQSTSTNDYAKIVIGQGQYQEGNGLLAFAHGVNQTNPHNILGTDNTYAGVVMDLYNKRIGIGGGSSKDPITRVHVSGGRIGIASTDSSYGQIRVANTAVAEASIGFFQGFTESTLNTNNPTATNKWAIGLGTYTGTANQFVIGNVGYAGVVQVNADGKTTFGETSGISSVGRVRVGTDTSSGWGTTSKYPWIGSDGTPSLIMLQNPHVPLRTDNARSGASSRAGLRMARNSSGDWWDMGLIGDEWELYRSGTGQLLHMSNAGKMTMGLTASELRIHGTGTHTRKIVLYDGGQTNNYQFYGFGVEGSSFINNIYGTADTFYWYAGVNSTSRQLAGSLSGTGVFNAVNSYQVNGTTVIDSSRNLHNINNAHVQSLVGVSDTNTYISFAGNDQTRFYQGGQERVQLNSTGLQLHTGTTIYRSNRSLYNSSSTAANTVQYIKLYDRGSTTGGSADLRFRLLAFNHSEYSLDVKIHIPTYGGFYSSYGTSDSGQGIEVEITCGGLSSQANVFKEIIEVANLSSSSDNTEIWLKIQPPHATTRIDIAEQADSTHTLIPSGDNTGWTTTAPSNQQRVFPIKVGKTINHLHVDRGTTTNIGGALQVAGTTVIDSSRNLQNINTFSKIFLNRQGSVGGLNFYSSSYKAWTIYMSPTGAGQGPTANITAPSGTLVTSWALRSFIENASGYGWTFESGTATGNPSVVAEIRASDGAAKFGSVTTGGITSTGTVTARNDYDISTQGGAQLILYDNTTDTLNMRFGVDTAIGASGGGSIQVTQSGVSNDRDLKLNPYGGKVGVNVSSGTALSYNFNVSGTSYVSGKATFDDAVVADTLHIRGDANGAYSESALTGGITLWGNTGASTSQIFFKQNNQGSPALGNHGYCTGDFNTYFVMDTTYRGWVFRNASTDTNVASISNTGGAAFNTGIKIGTVEIVDSSRNLTNIPSISNPSGLKLGNFTTANADEWAYVTWLRDTANNWDEGLIKGSSSRGVFGRQHFGIHMSDQRSFGFHSSGWDTEMEVSGDGRIYMKGPVGINYTPSNSNYGPLGRKGNLVVSDTATTGTNSTIVVECDDQGESSLYLCETSGTSGFGARLYYEGLGDNFFNIEIIDDSGGTKFPTAFTIDRDANVGINKSAPVGRFDVHQTYDAPSMCITSSNPSSWAASLIVGATTANGTLVDTNDRPMVIADGSYPVFNLNHTTTSNTHHGPTLQFSGNGYNSNRQWVIGTDGQLDHLDFGVSGGGTNFTNNKNPHMGISGYSGVTVMRLFQDGLLIGNSLGVYPNVPTSISHQLDVRGKAKVEGTGTGTVPTLDVINTSASAFNHSMEVIAPNMTTGQTNIIVLGRASSTKNAGYLGYNYSGTAGSNNNYLSLGHWGHDNLVRLYGDGHFEIHAGGLEKYVYNKAIGLRSSGTSSSGSAIGFQQITAEGWTGIFVDYNPYEGWGLYHDNPSNYFYITAELATNSLSTSFTVPNRDSGTSTAYAKVRFDQNNGNIDLAGSLSANGNVTAYASDRRLKTNFRPIESAVEKVQQLNGMIFDWNDVSEKHGFVPDTKYDDIGLIAQEVQEVVPQAVDLAPFDTHVESTPIDKNDKNAGNVQTKSSVSGEDYLTVKYEKLVPLLVSAIKEQADEIAELKAMIKEIKDGNH